MHIEKFGEKVQRIFGATIHVRLLLRCRCRPGFIADKFHFSFQLIIVFFTVSGNIVELLVLQKKAYVVKSTATAHYCTLMQDFDSRS